MNLFFDDHARRCLRYFNEGFIKATLSSFDGFAQMIEGQSYVSKFGFAKVRIQYQSESGFDGCEMRVCSSEPKCTLATESIEAEDLVAGKSTPALDSLQHFHDITSLPNVTLFAYLLADDMEILGYSLQSTPVLDGGDRRNGEGTLPLVSLLSVRNPNSAPYRGDRPHCLHPCGPVIAPNRRNAKHLEGRKHPKNYYQTKNYAADDTQKIRAH